MDTWRMSPENVLLGNDSEASAVFVLFDSETKRKLGGAKVGETFRETFKTMNHRTDPPFELIGLINRSGGMVGWRTMNARIILILQELRGKAFRGIY